MQVDPRSSTGILKERLWRDTAGRRAARGLARAGPTFLGYSMQGLFKFGLYEVFKIRYAGSEPGEGLRMENRAVPGLSQRPSSSPAAWP